MKDDIEKAVLAYFDQDAQIRGLYEQLGQRFDKKSISAAFIYLRELGYVIHTNPRSSWAATYCITEKGRQWLQSSAMETI